jgi:hypothetical protein
MRFNHSQVEKFKQGAIDFKTEFESLEQRNNALADWAVGPPSRLNDTFGSSRGEGQGQGMDLSSGEAQQGLSSTFGGSCFEANYYFLELFLELLLKIPTILAFIFFTHKIYSV